MVEFTSISRSESDNGEYVAAVTNAVNNYEAFVNFKKHPAYASYQQATVCLQVINHQTPEMLENVATYLQNDLIGGSSPQNYPIGKISPST